MMHVETRGAVAVLRMDDGKVNAISPGFLEAFPKFWSEVGERPVVLAGNAKAFCAGLDLKAVAQMERGDLVRFTRAFMRIFRDVLAHPLPVVAAVDRGAIAGGAVLALAADLRVGTRRTKIGVTEVPVGVPFPGPVFDLARLRLPANEHAEALLRGTVREGAEAHARGWIDHLVEDDPQGPALMLAAELASFNPLAFRLAKEGMNRDVVRAFDAFERTGAEAWVDGLLEPQTQTALARTLERLAKR